MRTSQTLLLAVTLALMVLSLDASRVVVPAADCSVMVIGGKGQPCEARKCEVDCRKEHDGMGACAASGCSCAVCAKYPPSLHAADKSQKLPH